MDLKKLFHVLVVGGATLAATGCGQGTDSTQQSETSADGGTVDGGRAGTPPNDGGTATPPGGGGPTGW